MDPKRPNQPPAVVQHVVGQLGVPELAPASCVLQPRVVRGVLAWVGRRGPVTFEMEASEGVCPRS